MKCMYAQTRPRFILSSKGVLGGMEFEPMLTPREKSPLPKKSPEEGSNPRRRGQRAQALPTDAPISHEKMKEAVCAHQGDRLPVNNVPLEFMRHGNLKLIKALAP